MRVLRQADRRGALILVVLAVLVLFTLVGVAFLLSASQHSASARSAHRSTETGDPPRALLDRALYQLLRGTRSRRSVVAGHDLLGDFYGHDGFRARLTAARFPGGTGGQFLELRIDPSTVTDLGGSRRPVSRRPGSSNGCVLTLLTGPLGGTSCRIVGDDGRATFRVLRPISRHGMPWRPDDLAGAALLVNGRPFNGTGFGYDVASGALDRHEQGWPAALLPNRSAPAGPTLSLAQFAAGGADESYDAADYQNVALALMPVEPREEDAAGRGIPSFHRPALINYWTHQNGGELPDALRRKIVLRPNRVDHPEFPAIDPVDGPWDIDNDGDGVRDSVWIDLGLPARAATDGRLHKPLFALLCLDLDSRLNVNAHGNRTTAGLLPPPTGAEGASGGAATPLPRGQGYGPPEISLAGLFPVPGDYAALLNGSRESGLPGRYGADGRPGGVGVDLAARLRFFQHPANYLLSTGPGGLPTSFASPDDLLGRLSVQLDPRGQPVYAGLGAPAGDTPYEVDLSRTASRGEAGAADAPFTVAELEQLLRPYDCDSVLLPDRLARLVGTLGDSFDTRAKRRIVTTHSFDPPVPSLAATPELQAIVAARGDLFPDGRPLSVLDLLAARLAARGAGDVDPGALLPPDLVMGLRMDLNRPWGDGRDNNGNGVVDDPAEALGPEPLWADVFAGVSLDHDNDGRTRGDGDARLARQQYARHLYVLMMLLTDEGYLHPVHPGQSGSLTPSQRRELTATRLAQWAVNAVDFRDADACMTPFEFDLDPFDGWQVDGWLGSDDDSHPQRRLVWGCEAPHLLLTETLAFHDTRLVDSRRDTSEKKRDDDEDGLFDPEIDDDDLDQARVPQGSLFVELYCTAPRQGAALPRELYRWAAGGWQLDLGRLAPPARGSRQPVWRLAITESHTSERTSVRGKLADRPETTTLQPQQFDLLDGSARVSIERIVSFATAPPAAGERDRTFYNRAGAPALVAPGAYAVVGPRRRTTIGSKVSGSTGAGGPSPHAIRLDLPPGRAVGVDDNGAGPPGAFAPQPGVNVPPATGIAVAMDPPAAWRNVSQTAPEGIGLNVSEPLASASYYPEPRHRTPGRDVTDAYGVESPAGDEAGGDADDETEAQPTYPDRPLDQSPGRPLADDRLLGEGTQPNYRTVFLQRLADPLQPHDPVANPYITVDWMPIDLAVFNGEDRRPEEFPPEMAPWNPPQQMPRPLTFASRERGLPDEGQTTTDDLWRPASQLGPPTGESGPNTLQFRHNLRQTLGYLNSTFGEPQPGAPPTGDPPRPFPWITWNDRPFVNQHELLLVPCTSPARLLLERSDAQPLDPDTPGGPIAFAADSGYAAFRAPYRHLLNFFHASTDGRPAGHFHRLLDYVHVPSRFVGTETFLNPKHFAGGAGTELFHPPFNRVSHYRDPGRVNVNTVGSWQVWNGILAGHPGPNFGQLADSRRGYPGANPFDLHPDFPTRFANPFRAAAGHRAPLPRLRRPDVECTLLRPAPAADDSRPLFTWWSTAPYDAARQNPYFFYRPLSRVTNLVTTRSNVYAVWITVGNFEVEAVAPDAAHPDGYRLGRELGGDTGQIARHRGFYLIDRTLPVAYQPGVNHNVDQAILLRRRIE